MKTKDSPQKALPKTKRSIAIEKRYVDIGFIHKPHNTKLTSRGNRASSWPPKFPSPYEDVRLTYTTLG